MPSNRMPARGANVDKPRVGGRMSRGQQCQDAVGGRGAVTSELIVHPARPCWCRSLWVRRKAAIRIVRMLRIEVLALHKHPRVIEGGGGIGRSGRPAMCRERTVSSRGPRGRCREESVAYGLLCYRTTFRVAMQGFYVGLQTIRSRDFQLSIGVRREYHRSRVRRVA